MAVVIFDPAKFKLTFPEFAAVSDQRLAMMFNFVTAGAIDNTDASIVVDPDRREAMIYLLIAHRLAIFGTAVAGAAGSTPSGIVGRLSSATEGSVSSSFAFDTPAGAGAAWYNQTPYGAEYWMLMAPCRSFRYVANGQSGIGRALAYGSRRYPVGSARYVAPIGPIVPGGNGLYVDEAGNQYADQLGTIYIGTD
jgi:hypothetical protein